MDNRVAALEAAVMQLGENVAMITNKLDALGGRMDTASQVFQREQDRIQKLEDALGKGGGAKVKEWKPLLESKAIQNLTKLGSNRSEYRGWAERLTNALEAMRPGARTLFKVMGNKVLAEGMPMKQGKFDHDKFGDWYEEAELQDPDLREL